MRTCKTCRYWGKGPADNRPDREQGPCRRNPPVVQALADNGMVTQKSMFPMSRAEDGCGEHSHHVNPTMVSIPGSIHPTEVIPGNIRELVNILASTELPGEASEARVVDVFESLEEAVYKARAIVETEL